jgi:general nucleoside transport system permease protein
MSSFLPVLAAVIVGFAVSGIIAYTVGQSPITMFKELILGAFVGPQFGETVARAVPLVGMTLCAAIPLRAGMVNLGGDGQLVLGGCASALIALYLPVPEGPRIVAALAGGALVGGAYGSLAALGENFAHVPMLISSWLLAYPAKAFCSFLVRMPQFHDPVTAWPATYRIAHDMRLTTLFPGTPITQGFILIVALAALVIVLDRRSTFGFELRMRGLNERFARYSGVALGRQTIAVMFASGAIAGLVGAILVLGSQYRFTDNALTAPQYGWSGTLAALLAGGEPVAAVVAGFLFAALQTGGFAMERSVQIPRVLTMVLESVIILFLSMRGAVRRRAR